MRSIVVVLQQTVSGPQKELIEQAAQVIASDNAELATAFLQKTAVEKAIPEIDKHLTNVSSHTGGDCYTGVFIHLIFSCL